MTSPSDDPLTPLSYRILLALADGPRHGYGIIKEIEETTGEPLRSSTGTLYLAIDRLREEGLIEEDSAAAPGDSRRRYYRLTLRGRAAAAAETRRLATLVGVARGKKLVPTRRIDELLRPAPARRR